MERVNKASKIGKRKFHLFPRYKSKIESKLIDALTSSPNFESNSGATNLQFPWTDNKDGKLVSRLLNSGLISWKIGAT